MLAAGCTPDPPREAADPDAPRFVSLNPCLDAILVEVAREDQIRAISHYSHQPGGSLMAPALAARFAATGGTAEEIIALEPDIVLASTFIDPATHAALERAGLRIETFDSPRTVAQSAAQVERLAALAGNPSAGRALIGEMMRRHWALAPSGTTAAPTSSPDPSVLLWQAGQIVAGQQTLIAQLLREEGFASHSAALGLDQADYVTLEQVLSAPPDLLLVAGDSAGQQHPALEKLADTRVHHFDPALFYCGGPSIPVARRELAALRASFAGAGR